MNGWQTLPLGKLADEITVGFVGSMASEYVENGLPFLRSLNVEPLRINRNDIKYISTDFHKRIRKSHLNPGDVVIVRTGKPGSCAVIPDWLPEANCSDLVIVRCGKNLNNQFLAYYVNTMASGHVSSHIVGAVQQHFNVGAARTLPVYLPPMPEQMAIVATLAALDNKIQLNRQMNETLEAMARAVFKDWFVDFGPTRAKMEGRPPYLAPEIWSLFPDRLDDEGKPEGWSEGSLSDIASLNPETWSRANYPETVEYVDLSNTKWGTIEAVTHFTSGTAPSRAQRILRVGDTIVGTVRPGNGSYAFVSEPGLTGSTGFAALRPIKKKFREVVYLAVTSKDNIDRLSHLADGGAYPAVRPELVVATALVTAPEAVFAAFSAATSALIDRAEANKLENRTLATTRDLLLPKLMSGEIRVHDAEKALEAMA